MNEITDDGTAYTLYRLAACMKRYNKNYDLFARDAAGCLGL